MSENGSHPHEPVEDQVRMVTRSPSPAAQIGQLNLSLNKRANEIRELQDREVFLQALVQDVEAENAACHQIIGQMRQENLVLRKRLGLPEIGAIELTDDEADELPDDQVTEVAD